MRTKVINARRRDSPVNTDTANAKSDPVAAQRVVWPGRDASQYVFTFSTHFLLYGLRYDPFFMPLHSNNMEAPHWPRAIAVSPEGKLEGLAYGVA